MTLTFKPDLDIQICWRLFSSLRNYQVKSRYLQ